MSDFRVRRGENAVLDRVEGNLILGNHATVQAANGKKVVVTQGVFLEGKALVNCDLECDSLQPKTFLSKEGNFLSGRARIDLTGRYPGRLEVNGNLTVHKRLDIAHFIEAKGAILAENIDVGGKIFADSIVCSNLRVGGYAQIDKTFEAQTVEVGGKVYAPGTMKLGDLRVGGEARVGGGSITGNIRVGGKFNAEKALEFGDLQVYGRGFLPANCTGRRISTFGKLSVEGNIKCEFIEVGGFIEVHGDCQADRVEVGGKLEVSGSLSISDRLEGFGATEVEGNFTSGNLRVSGRFTANRIEVKEEADASGKIETRQGMKAKLLIVRTGSRCDGILVAERVEVGKSADLSWGNWGSKWAYKWAATGAMSRVDDVYAREVVLGPMCRAGHIFADIVKLEQGSAAEQITYTTELKMDLGAAVCEPPKKVTDLPKPPF